MKRADLVFTHSVFYDQGLYMRLENDEELLKKGKYCINCRLWEPDSTEQGKWGICHASDLFSTSPDQSVLSGYIKPAPKSWKTNALFFCPVFQRGSYPWKTDDAKASDD